MEDQQMNQSREVLRKNNIFATPKDFKEIENIIEAMPREQRSPAYTAVMMTWNLACEMSSK